MQFTKMMQMGETTVSNFILEYYAKLGLTEFQMVLWLQIYRFQKQGNLFPNAEELAKIMQKTPAEINQNLQKLIDLEVLSMETSRNQLGELISTLNVENMFVKIEQLLGEFTPSDNQPNLKMIKNKFEEAFGRMLNSIELEAIREWVDGYNFPEELLLLALKEAILNNVRSFKYIDRILMTWKEENLLTKEAVEHRQNQRRIQQMQQKTKQEFGE